jgi:hypothetical protein
MRRLPLILLALIINYLLARPARADIIYTFTTTSPAPLAGPVSGSFVVPDSAILNNFITASEITSYNFILPPISRIKRTVNHQLRLNPTYLYFLCSRCFAWIVPSACPPRYNEDFPKSLVGEPP